MKIALITIEKYREIFNKQFKKDEWFKPTMDRDGNIFISEIEVNGMSEIEYPWKANLVLKTPNEVLRNFTKEQWIDYDIAETEKRLAELKNDKK